MSLQCQKSPQRPFGLFLGPPFHLRYCVPPKALDSPPTLWCHRRARDVPPTTRRLSFSAISIFNYPSYPARQTSRQGTKNDRRQDLDQDTRGIPSGDFNLGSIHPLPTGCHAQSDLRPGHSRYLAGTHCPSPPRGLTANRRQTETPLPTTEALVFPLPSFTECLHVFSPYVQTVQHVLCNYTTAAFLCPSQSTTPSTGPSLPSPSPARSPLDDVSHPSRRPDLQ